MGLLYCNNFGNYASVTDIDNSFQYSNGVKSLSATGGPFNGPYFVLGGATTFTCQDTFSPSTAMTGTYGASFWIRTNLSSTSGSFNIFALNLPGYNGNAPGTGSSNEQLSIQINRSTGSVSVTQFHAGNVLVGTTPNGVLTHNNWHNIQLAAHPDNSTGTAKVWVDGVLHVDFTGDTAYSTGLSDYSVESWVMSSGTATASYDIDVADIIIWDDVDYGRGPSDLTTFDGAAKVIELKRPNGAGSYSGWTSSSGGANYTDVDETALSSTDYVYASANGTADSYTFENLSTGVNSILGIAVSAMVRRAGVTATYVDGICVSSGSSAEADQPRPTRQSTGDLFLMAQSFIGQDPATSTAWTTSGFDAAEFGIKLETTT